MNTLRQLLIRLGGVAALIALVVWLVFVVIRTPADPRTFFTGTLVFEDFSECGLVRARKQDYWACALSSETCTRLRDQINKRVRIAAVEDSCERAFDLKCSSEGEFNQSGFAPKRCYKRVELLKVF